MSAWSGTVALGLLAGLVFTAAISLALAAAWPAVRGRVSHRHPSLRARVAWLVSIAPGTLPMLLVALCFAAGLPAALGLSKDHCTRHRDHPHLCLTHASAPLTPGRVGLLVIGAAFFTAAVVPEAMRLARTRRWLAGLRPSGQYVAPDVTVVESQIAFSFAVGLWRARIKLADALVRALPAAQLAAVIEHERAHVRRRDPLGRLAAGVFSRAHLPHVRRALLAELALASEQACDAEAAERVGDRLTVAEAILSVERALASGASPVPPAVPAFGGSSVAQRVREILEAEPPAPRRGPGRLAAALALASAPFLADPLHHVTEHLLALLTRLF